MDSPQSVVSPFKSSGALSKDIEVNGKEAVISNHDESIGVIDVFIHQARDIQNICIYHKQDVYAKICLTSDPENTVSTKTINGGGRNPVFNENLRLSVRTVDSALKCEIWMLSRVKNYLEDQLLGFALVPLSEVLVKKDAKLEKEFSVSSTDLFHSPAGFIQLSLAYTGASPDVMAISVMPTDLATERDLESETSESMVRDLDKIEFPDPKILNEDHLMVSEYYGIPCDESQCTNNSFVNTDVENCSSEAGVHLVESFSACGVESVQPPKVDNESPPSSVSTNGVSSPLAAAKSDSFDAASSKFPVQEQVSGAKEKIVDAKDGDSNSSNGVVSESFPKPFVTVNIEPEPKVVQQDIVDMYMKSMQQSLANMKLPLDFESGPNSSGSSTSEQKLQASKNGNSSRVFYGSRAFF
ncbi:putative C2 domain-containing protein [Lupinus albus]|uniref:Putative C2 domain-containing protein n=1 Tax=Lupinus albus TaxID=3870 RepID=A0A6A4PYA3_LUPAL|nr:putative C2 domain-containing protein [Lupinus albus]